MIPGALFLFDIRQQWFEPLGQALLYTLQVSESALYFAVSGQRSQNYQCRGKWMRRLRAQEQLLLQILSLQRHIIIWA